ncbi:MAG: hypothetical protein M4579_006379 [Chaenotheca gracillima]|nr:MAG: hypothetical protein M4579_006379 [Chaenotheca gracillima]
MPKSTTKTTTNPRVPAQTLRQARKAYQKSSQTFRLSETELRKLRRREELQQRAQRLRDRESSRRAQREKREEKERREREGGKKKIEKTVGQEPGQQVLDRLFGKVRAQTEKEQASGDLGLDSEDHNAAASGESDDAEEFDSVKPPQAEKSPSIVPVHRQQLPPRRSASPPTLTEGRLSYEQIEREDHPPQIPVRGSESPPTSPLPSHVYQRPQIPEQPKSQRSSPPTSPVALPNNGISVLNESFGITSSQVAFFEESVIAVERSQTTPAQPAKSLSLEKKPDLPPSETHSKQHNYGFKTASASSREYEMPPISTQDLELSVEELEEINKFF